MPTISFEFLGDELDKAHVAMHAEELYFALRELDNRLRNAVKYDGKAHLAEAREMLHDVMDYFDISLDMLP